MTRMYFTIDFQDRCVTYDTFVHDVAATVVRMLADVRNDPDMVSQRQAYSMPSPSTDLPISTLTFNPPWKRKRNTD